MVHRWLAQRWKLSGANQLTIMFKLGIKELLNKEQIGIKKLFSDYQLFYMYHKSIDK